MVRDLVEDMLNGNIEIRPTKSKKHTACRYCNFASMLSSLTLYEG